MITLLTNPTLRNGKAVNSSEFLYARFDFEADQRLQPLNRFSWQAISAIIRYKVLNLGVLKMSYNETIKFR